MTNSGDLAVRLLPMTEATMYVRRFSRRGAAGRVRIGEGSMRGTTAVCRTSLFVSWKCSGRFFRCCLTSRALVTFLATTHVHTLVASKCVDTFVNTCRGNEGLRIRIVSCSNADLSCQTGARHRPDCDTMLGSSWILVPQHQKILESVVKPYHLI